MESQRIRNDGKKTKLIFLGKFLTVDSCALTYLVRTLESIKEFARSQVDRSRFIRVMKYVRDSNKIKDYRERLEAAMNRFEVGYLALVCENLPK